MAGVREVYQQTGANLLERIAKGDRHITLSATDMNILLITIYGREVSNVPKIPETFTECGHIYIATKGEYVIRTVCIFPEDTKEPLADLYLEERGDGIIELYEDTISLEEAKIWLERVRNVYERQKLKDFTKLMNTL